MVATRNALLGAIVAGLAACGGTFVYVGPDASVDGGVSSDGASEDGGTDGISDAELDWFAQFDGAHGFDGFYPPAPGEFPAQDGSFCKVDYNCGSEGLQAHCDIGTGWCCSGEGRAGKCVCGYSLGCLPPEMCCDYPEASVPVCATSVAACRDAGGRGAWEL